jgi:glycyl-tRNA synthetase alpha subunit
MVFALKRYWAERGCIIQEPYDVEVGAGTMCPETFLRVLGPKPYRVAYVIPAAARRMAAMARIQIDSTSTSSCR